MSLSQSVDRQMRSLARQAVSQSVRDDANPRKEEAITHTAVRQERNRIRTRIDRTETDIPRSRSSFCSSACSDENRCASLDLPERSSASSVEEEDSLNACSVCEEGRGLLLMLPLPLPLPASADCCCCCCCCCCCSFLLLAEEAGEEPADGVPSARNTNQSIEFHSGNIRNGPERPTKPD